MTERLNWLILPLSLTLFLVQIPILQRIEIMNNVRKKSSDWTNLYLIMNDWKCFNLFRATGIFYMLEDYLLSELSCTVARNWNHSENVEQLTWPGPPVLEFALNSASLSYSWISSSFYFVYLFLLVLILRCCRRAFSNCGQWGLLSSCGMWLLTTVTSLAEKSRAEALEHGLSSCEEKA